LKEEDNRKELKEEKSRKKDRFLLLSSLRSLRLHSFKSP